MTQPWPNPAVSAQRTWQTDTSLAPTDLAKTFHKLGMQQASGALMQFGFAVVWFAKGAEMQTSAGIDYWAILGAIAFASMLASIVVTIGNWDIPHRSEAHSLMSATKKRQAIANTALTFAILIVGVIFLCLFGEDWLKSQFGVSSTAIQFIVAWGFLLLAIAQLPESWFLFTTSARLKAQH